MRMQKRVNHLMSVSKSDDRCGFSLIELMIVLVISLVVAAFALPNITGAITSMRLRSSVSSIAGVLQETRILAHCVQKLIAILIRQVEVGQN